MFRSVLAAAIAAAALACGGGGGAEQYDAARPPPPPPKKPAIDPAIEAQCARILQSAWKAIEPALDKLQIVKTSQVEKAYLSTKPFMDRCVKLPNDSRDCLTGSSNPIEGIRSCKINEKAKGNGRLYAPSLRAHVELLAPRPLPTTASARLLIAVDGTWKGRWDAKKLEQTWTLTETGDLEVTSSVDGGEAQTTSYTIHFDEDRRMKATIDRSVRRFVFVQAERKTLFASQSLLYDAFPVDDDKELAVRNGDDYILFAKGGCEVVTTEGLMAEAECKHGRTRGRKSFSASYELPGGVSREVTYWRYGDYLVHEKLVECCMFRR